LKGPVTGVASGPVPDPGYRWPPEREIVGQNDPARARRRLSSRRLLASPDRLIEGAGGQTAPSSILADNTGRDDQIFRFRPRTVRRLVAYLRALRKCRGGRSGGEGNERNQRDPNQMEPITPTRRTRPRRLGHGPAPCARLAEAERPGDADRADVALSERGETG